MAQVFKLYRIQQVDTKIDEINKRLVEIESEFKNDRRIVAAKNDLNYSYQKQTDKQKEIKNLENETAQFQIKLEQNQSSLYGGKITNPKELQDLQNESDSLRRKINDLEDKLIDLMIEVEEINEEVKNHLKVLEIEETEFTSKVSILLAEKNNYISELARYSSEREAIASTIPPDELFVYEGIRKKRKGIAVSKVVEQSCSACGSSLSSTLLHQAKSPSLVAFCETCGRILYAD